MPDKEILMSLAQDLPAVWNASTTDMRLKQRIVRILIYEIVVDVNEKDHETVLLIHWAGGRHSELRVKKNRTGRQAVRSARGRLRRHLPMEGRGYSKGPVFVKKAQ